MGFAKLQEMVKSSQEADSVETKDEVRITLRLDLKDPQHKKVNDSLKRIMEFLNSKRAPTVVIELLEEASDAFIAQVIEGKTE